MFNAAISEEQSDPSSPQLAATTIDRALVREALRKIVSSRHFQTSRRGKEFLEYVVNEKNNGHGDLLKERLIGTHLFGRKPDYSTGEDPVVRVQAGDVRRRLERYYADPEVEAEVIIQIPLGSYCPVFSSRTERRVEEPPDTLGSENKQTLNPLPAPAEQHQASMPDVQDQAFEEMPPSAERVPHFKKPLMLRYAMLLVAPLMILVCLGAWHLHRQPRAVLKTFWAPATNSSTPVLLCLPKPMVYRPSDELFERFEKAHPAASLTREARQDQILPLASTEKLQWGEMVPVLHSGPGIGGVIAAVNISRVLTEQGIRFELRFGEEATYAEMRDSPVVIVGAINTDWATQLTSDAAFAFDESVGDPSIHELAGAKRVWRMEKRGPQITKDYGLITRQLSGKSGQFLVQVAGISHFGTEAASELLVKQQELGELLRSKKIDLREKNLQIVISTDITNERAGPPHIVALSSW